MMDIAVVHAPFSDDQTQALNTYQRLGQFHPYTCGGERDDVEHHLYAAAQHHHDTGMLVAIKTGLLCPVCGYLQTWAHAMIANR